MYISINNWDTRVHSSPEANIIELNTSREITGVISRTIGHASLLESQDYGLLNHAAKRGNRESSARLFMPRFPFSKSRLARLVLRRGKFGDLLEKPLRKEERSYIKSRKIARLAR